MKTPNEQVIENTELLQEVDVNDKDLSGVTRKIAHSGPERYHRAVWIFIFNSEGQIFLIQRSKEKVHSPGMWDMVGGHQKFGDSIEKTADDELFEEIGIKTNLSFFKKDLLQNEKQSEFHYIFYGLYDGLYKINRQEVEQIKSFDCQKLLNHEYDSEYKILPHVYDWISNLKNIWEPLLKKSAI